MLTESAFSDAPYEPWFGRAAGKEPVRGAHALGSAFELMGSLQSFRRNAEIYGESEPADYFYTVVSGTVRAYKVLVDGRRQIGAFYLPGDTFGLEAGDEHLFSAEAVIDANVLVIKRNIVIALAARNSEVARELWMLTRRELRRAQNHLLLLNKSAEERVASFLLEMAERQCTDEVHLTMSRQDVADYLGLTIETVSRMLTRFENESTIALPACKRIMLRNRRVLNRLLA